MIFWTLLGTIVAVWIHKRAPHGSQGGHHGAQSLPYWSNMSPTFHNLFLSGRRKAPKTSQSDLHNAQMTPNASFRHGEWPKIVSKTCNHKHTHELPSDQRLQKPSISPELPKRKITSRCGGVASAFSIYRYTGRPLIHAVFIICGHAVQNKWLITNWIRNVL